MKIIHCADLHLDSKNFSKLTPQKRELKRHQMLQNFVDMVDFAEKNKVTAILLCGDIFDEPKVLKKTLKVVQDTILAHKDITFFYIWGNHDERVEIFDKKPSNFVVFKDKFSKVDMGDVCIGGMSFKRQIDPKFYESIEFQKSDFNILMLHCPVTKDVYCEPVVLKNLASKDIDYVALGHIHLKDEGKIDKRGIWAYSGCLESCSFSYIGQNYGFVLLDIKDGKLTRTFVPFAKYFYRNVEIDVSKLTNFGDILKIVGEKTSQFGKNDFVRVVFVGDRQEENEINVNVVAEKFSNDFFYLEVLDQTRLLFDLEKIANEKLSLKAEFLNKVLTDKTLGEEEKQQICNVGIEALKGEDISL